MSAMRHIMKGTQRSVNRSIHQMNMSDIYPCHKHICLCVEYLDFGKSKDRDRYKHCFITADNNAKYEHISYQNNLPDF